MEEMGRSHGILIMWRWKQMILCGENCGFSLRFFSFFKLHTELNFFNEIISP